MAYKRTGNEVAVGFDEGAVVVKVRTPLSTYQLKPKRDMVLMPRSARP